MRSLIFDFDGTIWDCRAISAKGYNAALAEMGITDRIYYSSFNHYSLLHVKEIDKSLPCGILYDATLIKPWEYAKSLGVDAIHPHFSELQIPGEPEATHAAGLEINTWTVNDEKDNINTIHWGADRIITNYPDRAVALLKKIVG